MTTIKLKNATTKPIALPTDGDPIEIAAGKEVPVPLELLRGGDAAAQLATGALEITRAALGEVPAAERPLASQVIGEVVLRLAPRFLAHHAEVQSALGNLGALRDRYNELHGATVKLLASAKALAPGVANVIRTSELLSATEDDAVAQMTTALEKHLTEMPKKPEELRTWYVAHKQLDAAREQAVSARDAARSSAARQLATTREQLDAAAAAFAASDPTKIGGALSWGG